MLKVGLLKELKQFEWRVMLTPEGVKVLVKNGIDVFVEHEAGEACKFEDIQYERAGATILPVMEKVFQKAELILQVQPPLPIEYELLKESHIFLSFLNLIQSADRMRALMDTKGTYISGELIQDESGKYPLLMGISEITGRMAIHQASQLLSISNGGKGKLLSGADIVKPAKITIIGAGKVGRTAAVYALANGACANLLSLKPGKLDDLKNQHPDINIEMYSEEKIRELLPETDVLIIAVYSLKNEYDIFISKEMLSLMEEGSVVIDISVERANVVETSHITNHGKPSYIMDGIVHYCVPNIAAIVPVTASRILTKKILPYVKVLAQKGLKDTIVEEPGFISGLSIYKGKITNRYLANHYGYEFYNIFELLELNL